MASDDHRETGGSTMPVVAPRSEGSLPRQGNRTDTPVLATVGELDHEPARTETQTVAGMAGGSSSATPDDLTARAQRSRRVRPSQATATLRDAGFSTREVNLLARAGVRTLDDVTLWSRDRLGTIPNAGAKTVAEIEAIVERHGLSLAPSNRPPRRLTARPNNAVAIAGSMSEASTARPQSWEPPNDRAGDMVARRMRGETLNDIAQAHGVTRERVRQILKREGVDRATAINARRARMIEAVEARREDILHAFRRGDSTAQIARDLDAGSAAVRALLDDAITPADRAHRRANRHSAGVGEQFSDEDLVAAVREVGDRYGRTPTAAEYGRAAAGGMLPSAPLIHARLGWREAVLRAGLTPRRSARRTYTRRWLAEACRHALRRIVVEIGEVPTVAQYDALAQLDDSLPSSATVRNRLGRWSTMTADLARLPTREEALARLISDDGSTTPMSEEIWMAYLDEVLSPEDAIVLLISGDLVFSPDFGPAPPELQDTILLLADIQAE